MWRAISEDIWFGRMSVKVKKNFNLFGQKPSLTLHKLDYCHYLWKNVGSLTVLMYVPVPIQIINGTNENAYQNSTWT